MRQGCTSERIEYLCKTQLSSTIETSDSPIPRPPPFQSTPTTPDKSHSELGKVYWSWPSLLQAQGQRGNSYKTSPWRHQQGCGIEILEAWIPMIQKQNSRRVVRQRIAEGENHWENQQESKCVNQRCWKPTKHSRASFYRITHDKSTTSPEVCSGNVAIYITCEYIVRQTET